MLLPYSRREKSPEMSKMTGNVLLAYIAAGTLLTFVSGQTVTVVVQGRDGLHGDERACV